ncbi:laminin subunit gamma-1 [Rousettus aegyptiacus]|uniref:Laminin subunit gamma-1 n=2 Tax=Rousettus aegyptiacus TaxID=9407 RepID=A0A7J8BES3_ROUAE|nr:laminin subunit gamma-1 [Rousettus aegyptiacus]KAF6396945.1 laminin subunit gamma 1 [Rousettus aegyptiacus]
MSGSERAARAPRPRGRLWPLLAVLAAAAGCARAAMDECTDEGGRPQRCMPEFVNAAFNVTVVATNTCGAPPEEYCVQTGVTGVTKSCHLCDAGQPHLQHGAAFLTDYNNQADTTWWQSQTMLAGVQYPNSINLTLHLGKAFDITYVRLKFHTSRPESFAIYKRTREDGRWAPYQYYSGSCENTYLKANHGFIRTGEDEQQALCTDEFSDISPLTGGNVAFSTLEGRPSAYNFDNSPVLQEWVTATDIRVTLNRLNTFGDEVFNDPKVLKSYYYAISDFAVGGRCKCNGHASECVKNELDKLVCNCKHNTDGVDCEKCLPFFNDRPWRRATAESASECLPCDCNGRSQECYFDPELYRATGHGGHCTSCRDNTDGARCERCRENFFRLGTQEACSPCHCSPVGSLSTQCDSYGRCSCKPGVMGDKCDRCQPGFHSLTEAGCRPCSCNPSGSVDECNIETGRCVCKDNVEGFNCERCKPGFFNLEPSNPRGCTPCFCFGHSSVCTNAVGYSVYPITSTFQIDEDGWRAEQRDGSEAPLEWSSERQDVAVISDSYFPRYFIAPAKFLGKQVWSYGQNLSFSFRVDRRDTRLSAEDVLLEGAGLRVSVPLIAQGNSYPSEATAKYVFRLHEATDYPWRPPLTPFEFQKLLNNLTSIKIRGTYSERSAGYLDDVTLASARPGPGVPAPWVEACTCPAGYGGQFCEMCLPGYRRETPSLGPYSPCVLCTCSGHSETCDPETGVCDCRDNTAGPQCERCSDGYYGDSSLGTSSDCQPCPCPGGSSCAVVPKTQEVVCTNCPTGTTGKRCELCDDGYFGDPLGRNGPVRLCRLCQCNDNIDPNAVGNCNRMTGECLKCIYNTAGVYCDRCRSGFFGNPLAPNPADKCKACNCNPYGTTQQQSNCNPVTGQCECLPHVTGRDCGACDPGFYNLQGGQGCERCDCHALGSTNGQCDIRSGQCECQPGITGQHCERCEVNHFGFGPEGCKPCDCHPEGSLSLQCKDDGRCECREGFVGNRCDRCEENYFYNRSWPGCQECPACYRLVKDKVAEHRVKLQELENLVANLGTGDEVVTDQAFEDRLKEAEREVMDLLREAQDVKDVDHNLMDRLQRVNNTLSSQISRLQNIRNTIEETGNLAEQARARVESTEQLIEIASRELEKAKVAVANVSIAQPESTRDPNNMTLLAEEARRLAERHKQEADDIVRVAKTASDTSTEAYNLLLKTLAGENQTALEIEELNRKYEQAKNISQDLERQAAQVHEEAKRAGDKAVEIYASVTQLTPVDSEALENEANKIKKEAEDLDRLIDQKLKDYEDLREDMRGKELEVKNLLEKGKTEQQTADQLLARADAAKALAEEAAKKGRNTLQEANDILNNLKDFDRRVNDNKTAAEEALKRIPAINQTIVEANEKTKEARQALGNAAADATEAKAKAHEAEKIASAVQQNATSTKAEAERTFAEVTDLDNEVNSMLKQLQEAEKELRKKQDDADQDMMMAGMASQAAQEAEINARKAKNSVTSLLGLINDLLEQLGQLDTVDLNKLNEIEGTLNKAKDEMKVSDLDRKVSDLENEARKQEAAIMDYNRDIEEIMKDIRNLEDIRKTLPSGCFNTPSIEKP